MIKFEFYAADQLQATDLQLIFDTKCFFPVFYTNWKKNISYNTCQKEYNKLVQLSPAERLIELYENGIILFEDKNPLKYFKVVITEDLDIKNEKIPYVDICYVKEKKIFYEICSDFLFLKSIKNKSTLSQYYFFMVNKIKQLCVEIPNLKVKIEDYKSSILKNSIVIQRDYNNNNMVNVIPYKAVISTQYCQ